MAHNAQSTLAEDREALLASFRIATAAGVAGAGVLDGQTSDELDEVITEILSAVDFLNARRDTLKAQEQAGTP